jgi:hypothetical protein
MSKTLIIASVAAMLIASAANAVVTITVEAPGRETTSQSVANPAIATFDTTPLGLNTGLTLTAGGTTATIDTLNVQSADVYGGAGGTGHYGAVQTGNTTTITFSGGTADYFGFYASAIDSQSSFIVFNGATVLYTNSLSLIPVAAGNFGNPDAPFAGQNAGQGYAFFNVNSTTPITKVVFTQANTFGAFEFDNLTIGTVPEPATWALLIAGFAMVGFSMRRRINYTTA